MRGVIPESANWGARINRKNLGLCMTDKLFFSRSLVLGIEEANIKVEKERTIHQSLHQTLSLEEHLQSPFLSWLSVY